MISHGYLTPYPPPEPAPADLDALLAGVAHVSHGSLVIPCGGEDFGLRQKAEAMTSVAQRLAARIAEARDRSPEYAAWQKLTARLEEAKAERAGLEGVEESARTQRWAALAGVGAGETAAAVGELVAVSRAQREAEDRARALDQVIETLTGRVRDARRAAEAAWRVLTGEVLAAAKEEAARAAALALTQVREAAGADLLGRAYSAYLEMFVALFHEQSGGPDFGEMPDAGDHRLAATLWRF